MQEKDIHVERDLIAFNMDDKTRSRLHFSELPKYAKYLIDQHLTNIAADQHTLFNELNPPVLQYFQHLSENKKIQIGRDGIEKLLLAVYNSQSAEYIESSIKEWLNNQLPQISRNQIEAEDITIISLIRRRILGKYVIEFSDNTETIIRILNELDDFTTISETISLKILLGLQQRLYEQQQKLSKIGNWVWDLKRNRISWSQELYRIYELGSVDITTIDLASYNHPEDADKVKHVMETSRQTRKPHDFHYRIILPGGNIKILHARGQILTDQNGEPETMFGTLQDVTEQKLVEVELKSSELFLQKITELTPSMISVYNIKNGQCVYINLAIETVLGYPREEILTQGKSFLLDIVHPDDKARMEQESTRTLNESNVLKSVPETIHEFQYRLRRRDGVYRWFYIYSSVFQRDSSGLVETEINVSIDISEQMKTSSLLRLKKLEVKDHEERYFRMINEIEDYAILRLSITGEIENWNSGAEKIKGYRGEEIIGKHIRIFYSQNDQVAKLPEMLINQATIQGKAMHEGWRIRKDGTKFWGSILITALHDEDKNVVGFSKVTRDLTQKKIADENLINYTRKIENSNKQLEEKNKQLESFNFIASHDLQEPVRKIKTFISKLRHEEHFSPGTEQTIDKISFACDRMSKLVEGLLLYCQGDIIEQRDECSLDVLLDDVLLDYSEQMESGVMKLERMKLPVAHLNANQMKQVFQNLISNSLKYKKDGEPLLLGIKYSLKKRKMEKQGKEIDCHAIEFSDNGIGFDQEYSDQIFELFKRLHGPTKYEGTGIGLALCSKIIKNHQGEIVARGQTGVGASFTVYLPVITAG